MCQVDDLKGRWQYLPMLTKRELEKVDAVVARSSSCVSRVAAARDKLGGHAALRDKVGCPAQFRV